MKVRPKDLGCLAYGVLIWGAAMVVGALLSGEGTRSAPPLIAGVALLGLGAYVHALYRRRRRDDRAEPATSTRPTGDTPRPTPPTNVERPPFGLVLVVSEHPDEGLFGQLADKLVNHVAEAPHYTLASDAEIRTLHGSELPEQNRRAVEPFVWAMQQRFGRRGGAWEVDFHEPMGVTFAVIYLE